MDTFVCAWCGQIFETAWTREQAEEEMRAMWGDIPKGERRLLCDDCFVDFKAWMDEEHPGVMGTP